MNGFYEWDTIHEVKGQKKQPYYFTLTKDRPMAFAGLWEWWKAPEDEQIESCTIITCGPNEIMEPFHERLPVILPSDLWDVWLDPDVDPASLQDLLVPCDSAEMQVSAGIHASQFNARQRLSLGTECIEPVDVV